jgi:murein DD-endopeptidase MepM/ murein hydrolase activator NlpD
MMNKPAPDFTPRTAPVDQRETQMSRRRLLGGAGTALGVGAFALLLDSARAQPRLAEFNIAGEALEPAVRIPPPTTTTTSTTVPPTPSGQIMFPIVVGPDDFCWVSDSFGDCRGVACSRLHEGVDIMADLGLPIRAPVSGRLTKRYVDYGASSGAGNGWTLVNDDGSITYKFFHMDRHEEGLEVDDEVEAGQIIGYVGNTGTSGVSSGTNHHLHFEYRPDNDATDSFDYLERDPNVSFEGE